MTAFERADDGVPLVQPRLVDLIGVLVTIAWVQAEREGGVEG